jgi:hypothetical protein
VGGSSRNELKSGVLTQRYLGLAAPQIGACSGGGHRDSCGISVCHWLTDHDHPALYELRAPEQGGVLKFVARHFVPFTDQRIATDPLTNGLVGIDRPKRQVLLAVEKQADPSDSAGNVKRTNVFSVMSPHSTLPQLLVLFPVGSISCELPEPIEVVLTEKLIDGLIVGDVLSV